MSQHQQHLFGRDQELVETDAALAAAASGQPRVVLVAGDAGIGKTALVSAMAAQAHERGFTALTGHCLDIETGVPLDPVREALRNALAGRRVDTLPPVTRRLAPYLGITSDPGTGPPTSLLGDLRMSLGELAREAPLMLALEDMQWADRSTQDFALAVARTARDRTVLVLTFRTNELTRRHLFRHALGDIRRAEGAIHIDLEPLDREALTALVMARRDDADAALVAAITTRSEGNPLYAEELLASRPGRLPARLGDLLLTRTDALTPATRELLRLASANGTRIDPVLVGAATGQAPTAVEAHLREALELNVVTQSKERIVFRHGLLREAIYEDLMPGERARAHADLAEALQQRIDADEPTHPSLDSLGKLAYHHHAAHQLPQAFAASVRAGLDARRFGAPDALDHLERALDLWDQVPDPDNLGALAKPDLLRLLAITAEGHGQFERADRYILAALDALEGDSDPLLTSRVYAAYGAHYKEFTDGLDQAKALDLAVTHAEGKPSEELAKALTALACWRFGRAPMAGVIELATRAYQVAVEAGCPHEQPEPLWCLSMCLYYNGQCREGLDQIRKGVEVARADGQAGTALEFEAEMAYYLIAWGQRDRGQALAEDVHARALTAGLPTAAAFAGEHVVEALRNSGQLTEADLLLEQLRTEGMHEYRWTFLRSDQLFARGDLEGAAELDRELLARAESGVCADIEDVARQVDLFAALGRIEDLLPRVDRHLADRLNSDAPLILSMLARSGYSALAAAAAAGIEPPATLPGRAADALDRSLGAMSDGWSETLHAAHCLLAAAIARTLARMPAVDAWRLAADAATGHGDYVALRPRLGLAEALIIEGEREKGRALLVDAWQTARGIGAGRFVREAARLARRHRVALPEDDQLPRPLARLTAREREVLDILATGATNRAIAGRLFITEKTVSVHVTNLMAKLDVSNRGEAAALARRLAPLD